jgi:gluconate 2-dehydrogenase gamma chain
MPVETSQVDRRELLRRAAMLLGGTVSIGTTMGVLSGCSVFPDGQSTPASAPVAGRFLSAEEMQIASAMADQVLPRTDTPGALDVGVPAFIDRLLADFHPEREKAILRAGLARAQVEARAEHQTAFWALPAPQMTALMTRYDQEAFDQSRRTASDIDPPPHFFRMMKEMTTVGFFTSETGASKVLKYAAVPGPWKADIPYSDVGRAWAT